MTCSRSTSQYVRPASHQKYQAVINLQPPETLETLLALRIYYWIYWRGLVCNGIRERS